MKEDKPILENTMTVSTDSNYTTGTTTKRIVLSYGMGVDSTAILLRWLADPTSRDFDLSELLVITAQTGNEFKSTGRLVENFILPLLKKHGVRFVQVARADLYEGAGIEILDDTTEPTKLYLDGKFTVADEWCAAATIQTSGGTRKCSLKFKGWVIDRFLETELCGSSFTHVIGFNSEEIRRVKKDQVYGNSASRTPSYPLVDWGWGRQACVDYIKEVTGVDWLKSACVFCPFSQGCDDVLERFKDEPEGAALAIEVERTALRFNPRMKLYKTKSVEDLVFLSGNHEALRLADESDAKKEWAVYRLRRAMLPKDDRTADQRKKRNVAYTAEPIWNYAKRGTTQRSVEKITEGTTRDAAFAKLDDLSAELGLTADNGRSIVLDTGESFPRIEEYLVAAPTHVRTKHGRWGRDNFNGHVVRVEGVLTATLKEAA